MQRKVSGGVFNSVHNAEIKMKCSQSPLFCVHAENLQLARPALNTSERDSHWTT